MSQVAQVQPRAKGGQLGKVAGTVGAIIGGVVGAPAGPAAAAQGAMMGNGVGNLAGSMLDPVKEAKQAPSVASGARGAIERRAAALQPLAPQDYGADLAKAEQAATQLPPDLQQQYMPALQAARQRSQGVV